MSGRGYRDTDPVVWRLFGAAGAAVVVSLVLGYANHGVGSAADVVGWIAWLAALLAGVLVLAGAGRMALRQWASAPGGTARPRDRQSTEAGDSDDVARSALDPEVRMLLGRARKAVDAITSSAICENGLLDRVAVAEQKQMIAADLRKLSDLRRRRHLIPGAAGASGQGQDERDAERDLREMVKNLEARAAEVRAADAEYLRWTRRDLDAEGRELLAAVEAHKKAGGMQNLQLDTEAVRLALRELNGDRNQSTSDGELLVVIRRGSGRLLNFNDAARETRVPGREAGAGAGCGGGAGRR